MNFCRVCHDEISEDAEACLKYRSYGMPLPANTLWGISRCPFQDGHF